jgi:hypothetical protein
VNAKFGDAKIGACRIADKHYQLWANSECKVWRCKIWELNKTLFDLRTQVQGCADALIEQHANHALCQRLGLMKDDLTSLGHSRASDQGACCQFSLSQLCSVLTMTRQAMQIADHALLQLGWADSKPVADPLDVCVVRWGRCRQGNGWTYGPLLPRSWAWGRT